MKTRLLILIFATCVAGSAIAHDHPVEDLLELPHPMHFLIRGSLADRLDAAQKERINALRSEIQPQFVTLMEEALPIQERLKTAVGDYGNKAPVSRADLERLAQLRIRMSEIMTGAYIRLKSILDAETWQALQTELAKDH